MTAGERPEDALRRALSLMVPTTTIVVAAEFIIVGLLPLVSQDMNISLARAGALAGGFAFSAAVAGPFVTLIANRLSARFILTATLLLYAMGNLMVALAANFGVMLAARAIQGAILPAFISVGASVVTQLAPSHELGKGLARANLGFVVGVLLALPAGVALAQGGDWRLPFAILAAASLLLAPVVAFFFPRLPPTNAARLGDQIVILRKPLFVAHLGLTALVFSGAFSAYTFLGAWAEGTFQLVPLGAALLLLLFGVAGVAGNGMAGRAADRAPMKASIVAILALVCAINLAALSGRSVFLAAAPLVLWGIAHTASVTLSQIRLRLQGARRQRSP